MPDYELMGMNVKFPFPAYPCQLDYMSKVIEGYSQKSIDEGMSALADVQELRSETTEIDLGISKLQPRF